MVSQEFLDAPSSQDSASEEDQADSLAIHIHMVQPALQFLWV